jgi:hypothetical protein
MSGESTIIHHPSSRYKECAARSSFVEKHAAHYRGLKRRDEGGSVRDEEEQEELA